MPYLGNPPAERFTRLSKQTITGDGGTAYTLDFPVGSDQDVEVFVNNVRQEPSVAYTVSGTSLTMTGAVQSSDDFYVVFQGKAVASVTHPAGDPLQATSGTFTGDLTVDTNTLFVDASANRVGIGTTSPASALDVTGTSRYTFNVANAYTLQTSLNAAGSSFADDFKNASQHIWQTSGTERMRIDSSGRVTMPYQPSFRVTANNLGTTTAFPFPWNVVEHNVGSHYNTTTHRFTVPIAGVYLFTLNVFKEDAVIDAEAIIRVNGVTKAYFRDQDDSGGYGNLSGSLIIKLSANDYVESGTGSGTIHINTSTNGMHFGGHLLG